jgi:hypothetical protein
MTKAELTLSKKKKKRQKVFPAVQGMSDEIKEPSAVDNRLNEMELGNFFTDCDRQKNPTGRMTGMR